MKKKKVVILVIIIVLFVGWYWFRPEGLVINRRVDEEFPTGNDSPPQILDSGAFHSGTHPTEGTATIYRTENGSRILRFTNFKTSNGPDVHIYMVAAEDARDSASVQHAAFIDLAGTHQGEHRRPKLQSRLRCRLGEVPHSVCVVQTL
jgi:hypothetical protein